MLNHLDNINASVVDSNRLIGTEEDDDYLFIDNDCKEKNDCPTTPAEDKSHPNQKRKGDIVISWNNMKDGKFQLLPAVSIIIISSYVHNLVLWGLVKKNNTV